MKLDTSMAWSEAAATVSANKEVLAAIAGVFFFLPAIGIALFFPQTEPPAGTQLPELIKLLQDYYAKVWPWLLVGALVQVLGQLAVLMLTARGGQHTVGDAIRGALQRLPAYLGTQLLILGGLGLAFGLVDVIAAASRPLAVLLALVLTGAALVISIRCLLAPVIIAVEGLRNPVAVLRRSWDLTRGNGWRLALFVVLLALVVMVIAGIASAIAGILFALIGGPATGRIAGDAASALVSAAAATYFAISFAAVHRQLAGTAGSDQAVFE